MYIFVNTFSHKATERCKAVLTMRLEPKRWGDLGNALFSPEFPRGFIVLTRGDGFLYFLLGLQVGFTSRGQKAELAEVAGWWLLGSRRWSQAAGRASCGGGRAAEVRRLAGFSRRAGGLWGGGGADTVRGKPAWFPAPPVPSDRNRIRGRAGFGGHTAEQGSRRRAAEGGNSCERVSDGVSSRSDSAVTTKWVVFMMLGLCIEMYCLLFVCF